MSKQIPELDIIATPTAGQESLIETVVARHDTYATSRMTLAQIFTLGSISGSIKVALDALSGLISGNTSSINTLSSTKLNIAWGTRTGLTAKAVVATDASGNEVLITGTLWQQIGFDVSNTPVAITPTVDVHGLTQKTTPIGADELLISDSEASFVNKSITFSQIITPIGTGIDWALSISSGTTTIAFDASGYVEKNYTSFTMTGGTLNFSGPATNGGIAVIKVSGDFSMTWSSIIDISGMGGLGTTSSSGSQWKYIVFNQNITNFWVIWSGTRLGWTGLGTNGGYIYGYCWGGGGSWASGAGAASWASGGWLIIIEVGWTFTFNTPSVIKANGANATNGWGGGGGWAVIIKYRTLLSNTWSITVNGGSSWSSTLGAGGGGGWSFSTGWTWWTIGNPGGNGTSNSFWTGGTGGTASGGGGGGGGWAGFYKIN
jgi:hypothetical protein